MGEGVKTVVFALIALGVAVAAVVSRPRQEELNVREHIDEMLFPKFDDPGKAAAMEIVKYDEELGQITTFKVAREKKTGAWVIPSHGGYPADAEERMRDAALMLVDLRVLDVASEVAGDHALYGVVAPDAEKLSAGDEGVGLLVRFDDKKDQEIAGLVIGQKVKGSEDQRFVRIPGQDPVYVVKIDPDKLSTKFEDWIEKDLLKLNSWDIEDVALKNYTVNRALNAVTIDKKYDFAAQYKDAEWKLSNLTQYHKGQPIAGALGPNEELNKDKLNDLKNAVDDLKIADVLRKPDGLGRDLKAGDDFMKNNEGLEDLFQRGFYPVSISGGEPELLCANGEVQLGMKDGVQYVLRFGDTAADKGGEGEKTEGENRYLFVVARVDMSKLPPPELEEMPEMPRGGEGAGKSGENTEAKTSASDDAKATETSDEPGADKDASSKDGAGQDENKAGGEDDKEAKESEIAKERERISKENERKLNEYNEKVKKAKEKVAELNTRFGDWYYVVSEEQYKKVFPGLDELIKEKETADVEGDGVDAFRDLQKKGIRQEEASDASDATDE